MREARALVLLDHPTGRVKVVADTHQGLKEAREFLFYLDPDPGGDFWQGTADYNTDFIRSEGRRTVFNVQVAGSNEDFYDPEKMDEPKLEAGFGGGLEQEVIWLINNVDANEAYRILRTARAIGGAFGQDTPEPSTADILHTAIVWERG